jgi:hypothetical protein
MAAKVNHRHCVRCGELVRQNADHVKACRWTESAVFHFRCFVAQMAEQTQTTAAELMRAARKAEV